MNTPSYLSDKKLAYKTTESCLTIVDNDIPTYMQAVLNHFIKDNELTPSNLEHRVRIYDFLNYQYLEFIEYATLEKYMLGEKYINRAITGKDTIISILTDFKNSNL